jgi:hypothetical protein
MYIAVVGSRTIKDYDFIKFNLDNLLRPFQEQEVAFVSGGAKGVDQLAERYAKENSYLTKIFLPDWDKYGKSAGPIRNQLIIEQADIVIAFWDGVSRGTWDSVTKAIKLKKFIHIIIPAA